MATFGNLNIEINEHDWGPSVDKLVGNRFQLLENGTLTEIVAYLDYYFAVPARATIYDNFGNLVAVSNEITVPGQGWRWCSFPFPRVVPLVAGYYWLCVCTSEAFIYRYQAGVGEHIAANVDYTAIPSILPAQDRINWLMSIYGIYTPTEEPPPPPPEVLVNSCDSINGWEIAEGSGGTGRSSIRLNTTKYTTGPASIEIVNGQGAWGVYTLWRAYHDYGPPMVYLDLSQMPILEFDVASDLQDPKVKLFFVLLAEGTEWGALQWGPFNLTSNFQKISIDLRLAPNMLIPDLTRIGYMEFVVDSGAPLSADTTVRIDNMTARTGAPMALVADFNPKTVVVLEGSTINFTSTVAGGVTPYSYSWALDGVVISTEPTCTILPVGIGTHSLVFTVTDAVGSAKSGTATITVYIPSPSPVNPGPWRTVGHKIYDAYGNEVYPRGIGTAAAELQSHSGMWTGKGDALWDWATKWVPINAELQRRMDDTLQCMNKYWYCNFVRVQGVVAEWWWTDRINPYQRYGQGPNSLVSCRDYWEFFAQRVIPANMTLMFCMTSVFSVYEDSGQGVATGNGGQPGALTSEGARFMRTIDPDEMVAWGKLWTSVVQRLGSYPNIVWELWNEPDTSGVNEQTYFNYVVTAYNAIRGAGDNHIIIIQSGVGAVPTWEELDWIPDWHNRLRTALGREPVNVAYAIHVYRHAPWFNQQWGTSYEQVYAQVTSPKFIPITRTVNVDVPVWCTETGIMLQPADQISYPGNVTPETEPTRLNNDLGWFDGILRSFRELGVGINIEFWMPRGQWPYWEALLEPGTWIATTPSPTPTVSGQMFIDAYKEEIARQYSLSVTATTGGTTNPAPNVYTHNEGTVISVTALPDTNYRFNHWELDATIRTENPITIAMTKDYSLRAIFEYVPPPPLTATIQGYVKDKGGTPIPGATVTCDGYADITEIDGAYAFVNIPAKVYTLTVTMTGYQPASVQVDASAGGTFSLDISLQPVAPPPPTPLPATLIGASLLGVIAILEGV